MDRDDLVDMSVGEMEEYLKSLRRDRDRLKKKREDRGDKITLEEEGLRKEIKRVDAMIRRRKEKSYQQKVEIKESEARELCKESINAKDKYWKKEQELERQYQEKKEELDELKRELKAKYKKKRQELMEQHIALIKKEALLDKELEIAVKDRLLTEHKQRILDSEIEKARTSTKR